MWALINCTTNEHSGEVEWLGKTEGSAKAAAKRMLGPEWQFFVIIDRVPDGTKLHDKVSK